MRAHGAPVASSSKTMVVTSNYDWWIEHSSEACRPIAEASVRTVHGRAPRAITARARIGALPAQVLDVLSLDGRCSIDPLS